MATELDTLAAGPTGAPEQQPEDYADLLDAAESLGIPDPNEDADEGPADEPAPDADDAPEDKPDGQAVASTATVEIDGRKVTIAEMAETFKTFQRKTQEYAETDSRRETEARQAIAQMQEQAAQQVYVLANGINELVLPGVDMQTIARLRIEDPAKAGELLTSLQIVERWKQDMFAKAAELHNQAQAQRKAAADKAESSRRESLQSEAEKLTGEKWFTDDFRGKARSFLKSMGIPEQFAGEATRFAGAVRIIRMAMQMQDAQKRLKDGKQPAQGTTQVSASARTRAPNQKQRSDALFANARKNPDDRKASAAAYTSLLGG